MFKLFCSEPVPCDDVSLSETRTPPLTFTERCSGRQKKLLDICELSESKLIELGGEIGFPTNICINEIAAHYSSPPNDESVIKEGDVVKIDIGVSVEGYVADGAFTVSFNQDSTTANLVTAVETAVMKGLSIIKPGVNT